MKRILFCVPFLALSLIVLGVEGPASANNAIRKAGKAVAAAAALDFGALEDAIAGYTEAVDTWKTANEATTAQEGVVAGLEADLAAAQETLATLQAEEESAAVDADDALDAVNSEHATLRE